MSELNKLASKFNEYPLNVIRLLEIPVEEHRIFDPLRSCAGLPKKPRDESSSKDHPEVGLRCSPR